jgi:peptidoglycan hydrolase-like protein with peptidoglycan-binding domain
METLAFLHNAVAHEDPNPDLEVRSFDELSFPVPGSVVAGAIAVGVVATTFGHADSAQALMKYGDRGSGVGRLQEELLIRRDNIYGSQTRSAVRSFQSRQGLAVDGIAGPRTLRALGLPSNLGPGGSSGDRPISGRATVTASVVNLRSAPWGSVTGKLYRGARVSLTGTESYSGGLRWARTTNGNWIATKYLSTGGSSRPISGGARITGNGVRVRDYPNGPVVSKLYRGDRVSLTGRTQSAGGLRWSQLTSGNWVASRYIN